MTTPTPTASGGASQLLKIVAGLTAVISLGLAIRQVVVYTGDFRARREHLRSLLATSRIQADGGDYPAAWNSLNQAVRIDPDNKTVRVARENLAQSWLDHSRTGGTIPSLSALADTLSPVLTQGLLQADSTHKADLIAHLGWADFLRWREGERGLNPPGRYREGLALDPRNPYAHAMLGHWMLWQGENPDSARSHFDAALAAGRAHDYVRGMELAAFANRRSESSGVELLRIADQMRRAGEPAGDGRGYFWDAFRELLGSTSPDPTPSGLTAAVPPADLLATYQWALQGSGYPDAQPLEFQGILARLQAMNGDLESAADGYRKILAEPNLSPGYRSRVSRALAALKTAR